MFAKEFRGIVTDDSTTKLATPLSVVHVPTWGNTDPPRDCGSLPSEYIPSRIYSTKYIHGKVPGSRGSGLKLPGRAFSVLPARLLSLNLAPAASSFHDFSVVLSLSGRLYPISSRFNLLINPSLVHVRARNAHVCAHASVVIARTTCTK